MRVDGGVHRKGRRSPILSSSMLWDANLLRNSGDQKIVERKEYSSFLNPTDATPWSYGTDMLVGCPCCQYRAAPAASNMNIAGDRGGCCITSGIGNVFFAALIHLAQIVTSFFRSVEIGNCFAVVVLSCWRNVVWWNLKPLRNGHICAKSLSLPWSF